MLVSLQSVMLVGVLVCLFTLVYAADPTGCTHDAVNKEYSCSMLFVTLPLAYSAFDNYIQVLKLVDVNGELPSSSPFTFTGFSSIDTSSYDPNKTPRLEIQCAMGGSLIITAGTFADMGWVKEFHIKDCIVLTLPDDVFKDLGEVNLFSIEGGSITNVGFNALNGMNVRKMESVKEPLGKFSIRNSRFISGNLPNGVLYPMGNVSSVVLENANIRIPSTDMFQASTKATYFSLANNPFTELPEGVFEKTTAMTEVDLTGISWTCSCSNLWLLQFTESTNVTVTGGMVCGSPTADQKAKLYYNEICAVTTACGSKTGINISATFCYVIFDLVFDGLLLITTILACVAFGMIIHLKRQTPTKGNRSKKPGMGGRKMSGSQWNKVGADDAPKKSKPRKKRPREERRDDRDEYRREESLPGGYY